MRSRFIKQGCVFGLALLIGLAIPSASAKALVTISVNCYIDSSGQRVCPGDTVSQNSSGLTCDSATGVCTYTPLEPIPGTPQNGSIANLGQFLQSLFRILFSIGALLAVGMLTIGGIEYMVSDVAHRKNEGLRRAQSAIYGMLILAGSWLILNTINPDLLKFNFSINRAGTVTPVSTPNSTATAATTAQLQTGTINCESGGSMHANADGTWSCN